MNGDRERRWAALEGGIGRGRRYGRERGQNRRRQGDATVTTREAKAERVDQHTHPTAGASRTVPMTAAAAARAAARTLPVRRTGSAEQHVLSGCEGDRRALRRLHMAELWSPRPGVRPTDRDPPRAGHARWEGRRASRRANARHPVRRKNNGAAASGHGERREPRQDEPPPFDGEHVQTRCCSCHS